MIDDSKAFALLGLILVGGCILAYVLYSGPYYAFDDHVYIDYAHQIQTGSYSLVSDYGYAYGYLFTAALALSFDVLGASPFSAILPQFLEYLAIVVMSFLLGRELYGNDVGVFSGFLAASAPFLVGYATRVLPDLMLGAVASLAMRAFVLASRMEKRYLWYFIAGSLASLTIYVKLTGLAFMLLLTIGALFLLFSKRGKNSVIGIKRPLSHLQISMGQFAALLLGMVLFFLLNLFTIYIATGNPFYTLGNYGQFQNAISPSSLGKNVLTAFALLFNYRTLSSPIGALVSTYAAPFGGMVFLALIGTAAGAFKRDKNIIFMSIVFWGVFLYLLFGSISLTHYTFAVIEVRYFAVVAAPLAVLGGYGAMDLVQIFGLVFKKKGRALMLAVVVLIAVIPNVQIYWTFFNYDSLVAADSNILQGVLSYVGNGTNSTINLATGDMDSADYMKFLSGYSGQYNITALNITHTGAMKAQMESMCNAQGSSYVAVVYTNASRLDFLIINSDWPYSMCNLTESGFFYNRNADDYGTYGSISTEVMLYRVQK